MYIRTKDGVYKVSHYNDWATHKRYGETLLVGYKTSYIKNENIINQSENIEDLCDEFVYNNQILSEEDRYNEEYLSQLYCFNDIYGAIWVQGKGLIYVAKTNEKGELCLL